MSMDQASGHNDESEDPENPPTPLAFKGKNTSPPRESRRSRSVHGKAKRSFEQAIGEVEGVVSRLESGQLDLAKSLDEYQRGVGMLKECYELLNQAERRIALLSGFDADGNPVVEPFDIQATSIEEKQASRSARRSASSAEKPPRNAPKPLNFSPELSESELFDGETPTDGLF